ncbi:MAG: DNA repair protein RadA [Candidatus Margulisbacteria bacterium]|jgi:DNA repair protein RadA/Sms|nr:DNA repair protein RadA [Candidatus Margulisiibacteriota bacterium]
MSKPETSFFCQSCGNEFPRWYGQCPACQEWNSLVEELQTSNVKHPKGLQKANIKSQKPTAITSVDFRAEERQATGIAELDRVLGGGVVPGSVVLVAGEPGIGKSTLMLQVAEALSQKETVLYVSGEESAKQIRVRAERLGTLSKNLVLYPETDLLAVENALAEIKPSFVVIDSIQTMSRADLQSASGSVSQVRECAAYLVQIAKSSGIPIFIVGHVTKEGNIAGPRVLEHVVDTVIYFEGEQHKQYRIVRATKNRFGSTNEVGIFEMKENGLVEVLNPSAVFLSERPENSPGSVVTAAIEGTRPMLIELQALVAPTKSPYPARKTTGVDFNRTALIIAVLERHAGLKLSLQDIYVNAAGGVVAEGTAMDLPIALAIASSYKNKPIDPQTAVVGEIGLAGEIRAVSRIDQRVKEAEKLGFKTMILPQNNLKELKQTRIRLIGAASLKDALAA